MRFIPYGPFELPRGDDGLLLLTKDERQLFWADVDTEDDGLSDACGCYVFAIRAGGGIRPWYVGKAERQSFKREALTEHKVDKYNTVLSDLGKGTPLLYFYARITNERANFSKPTTHKFRDISYLEKMLIGLALSRNPYIMNIKETVLLRDMCVPGLINSPPGRPTYAATELKSILGY
jgi:hypothetical protein